MKSTKLKKLPRYASDADAERFVAEADLSEYDLSGFRPLGEVVAERRAGRPTLGDKKREHISLRLDPDVIAAFKATGKGWQGRINDALRPYAVRMRFAAAMEAAKAAKAPAKGVPAKERPKSGGRKARPR